MSSVSNASSVGQVQIAVARMQLDSMEQQGRDAVSLIQSAAPAQAHAPANAAPGVGTTVNYSA